MPVNCHVIPSRERVLQRTTRSLKRSTGGNPMMHRPFFHRLFFFVISLALFVAGGKAQSSSGTLTGTVTDPSGAVIPNATVEIANHVSGYTRTATTDSSGQFRFYNIPFNPYHLTVTMEGFVPTNKIIDIESIVPFTLPVQLSVGGASTNVTINVESGAELLENDTRFHTDV